MADLQVTVGGNNSGFNQSLAQARAQARVFAKQISSEASSAWSGAFSPQQIAGAFGGYLGFEAIKNHIQDIFRRGNQLVDLAEQFDINTDAVQRWERATAQAGMTMSVFTRALDSLRAKRQAALMDEKAASQFTRLGIGRAELTGLGDVDLLMRVLGANAPRSFIGDIVGRRNVRLKAALEKYIAGGGEAVAFSQQDLETLHKSELQFKQAEDTVRQLSLSVGVGRLTTGATGLAQGRFSEIWKTLRDVNALNVIWQTGKRVFGIGRKPTAETSAPESELAGGLLTEDPEIIKRRGEEAAEAFRATRTELDKMADAEERLAHAIRTGLPEEQKRNSLIAEQLWIMKEVKRLETPVFGPPEETDAQRRLRITNYLTRFSGIDTELASMIGKAPPLIPNHFTPDRLAQVGLFSQATFSSGAVLNIQKEMLMHMASIDRKTGFDPHQ